MSAIYIYKTSHPSDPVASSLTFEWVSSELSMACERPLENTLRSAVLVTLVSASERRDPSADTESSHRMPPATPLCSKQTHADCTKTFKFKAIRCVKQTTSTDGPYKHADRPMQMSAFSSGWPNTSCSYNTVIHRKNITTVGY